MSIKKVKTQLSNFRTTNMYKNQFLSLAENVFQFKGLNTDYLDLSYINQVLVKNGSIAFFYDEVMGLLALPYASMGKNDVYNRPIRIQVHGQNGYTRYLKENEFVIMYDNMTKNSLFSDIIQYSERIAMIQRTIDINIKQQRVPRFWKTKNGNEKSIKDIIEGIDSCEDSITTFDKIDLDETTCTLAPAPFVADKLAEQKDKIWNEFLRLIGVANSSFQKKERNIRDEVFISQAGTIASRYSRFEARKIAIEKINKMFGNKLTEKIEVEYFDGLPTTLNITENEDNGGVNNDMESFFNE